MKLTSIAYHRNGVSGEGFYAVLFKYKVGVKWQNMVATVFPDSASDDLSLTLPAPCNGRISVLDVDLAASGNVTFGENSWRGDNFEETIRKWIAEYWTSPSRDELLNDVQMRED